MSSIGVRLREWRRAPLAAKLGFAADAISVGFIGWFLAVLLWGVRRPFSGGHFAAMGKVALASSNSLRFGIIYPAPVPTLVPPAPSTYYINHPFGTFWLLSGAFRAFGTSTWVVRACAAFVSAATAMLLWRFARRIWGKGPAAIAVGCFVSLPISLVFGSYQNLEVPLMFGCALSAWAYERMMATGKRRYVALSLLGVAWTLQMDWVGVLYVGTWLGIAMLRGWMLPRRWFPPFSQRRFGVFWSLAAVISVLTIGFYFAALHHIDRLGELISEFSHRTAGAKEAGWAATLKDRHHWIVLTFTRAGPALGYVAFVASFVRPIFRRTDGELMGIPLFALAIGHYVLFRQAADIHIFWPHYFALAIGFGMGAAAASFRDLVRHFTPKTLRIREWGPRIVVAALLAGVLVLLRTSMPLVRYGLQTCGNFTERGGGQRRTSLVDEAEIVRWFVRRFPNDATALFTETYEGSWGIYWEVRPRATEERAAPLAVVGRNAFAVIDARELPADQLRSLAKDVSLVAVGHWWLADGRTRPGLAIGYRLQERRPRGLSGWLDGSYEPAFTIEEDEFQTWSARQLLGQPTEVPQREPRDGEELRIAHNAHLQAGDAAGAKGFEDRLRAMLSPPNGRFGAVELLGVERRDVGRTSFDFYLRASAPVSRLELKITSINERPPRFSFGEVDAFPLDVTPRLFPRPADWTVGHIYRIQVPVHDRAGLERFTLVPTVDGVSAPALEVATVD